MKDEDRQSNIEGAYQLSQKALHETQKRLLAEGITYPLYDPFLSAVQNAEALDKYKAAEMHFYKYYLRHPSGERPIEEFPPKNDWSIKAYG